MWQLRRNASGNEAADDDEYLHEQRLDQFNENMARSASQNGNIVDFALLHQQQPRAALNSQRSLEKSRSLPVVNHRNMSFGLHPPHATGAMKNDTFGNFSSHAYHQGGASGGSNPFLDNSMMSQMMSSFPTAAAVPAGIMFAAAVSNGSTQLSAASTSSSSTESSNKLAANSTSKRSSNCSAVFSDEDLPRLLLRRPNNNNLGGGGGSHVGSQSAKNTATPSPTPSVNNGRNSCQIGPSKLYRLIASPPQDAPLDWDVILQRALSHPHEACFFDPNAGGHVFALHKLLRRTGDDPNCRPPFAVVEAVMKACPRAVTRKQAVVDEDNITDEFSNSASDTDNLHAGLTEGHMLPQQPPPNNNGPPQLLGPNNNNDPMDEDDASDAASQPPDEEEDEEDHDDVRYEYPLAIACEWEQDGEVVRLLASSLKKTNPVYRSEVFRSLDYASLPNRYVRILLEENPNCVLERGTSSEENEGDDDDSPLEKVLFWWDDPDMLGMEDDIASYPECNMRDDLCDLFEKLRMMLYAAAKGSMEGYDEKKIRFQVLHHVLRIVSTGGSRDVRFPNDFAHAVLLISKFILSEQVGMFQERDETGSLPLHIACSGQGLIRPSSVAEAESHTETTENDADAPVGDGALEDNDNLRNEEQAPDQLEEEDDDEVDDSDSDEGSERISIPSGMEVIGLLLENNPNSIRLRDSLTGSLPLHLSLQCNPQVVEVIEKFIDIFPLSISMPDGNGRLPLHIALLQKSPSWETILRLYPAALECRDPVTGLLPFQLAAISTSTSNSEAGDDIRENEDSLSLCFQLLRKNPCLATGLGKMKSRPQSLIEQQIMARYKPRVLKLEEENERLQQRVKELESQLRSMTASTSEDPKWKKRKSSSNVSNIS
ncbi:hypothetical protein ACHAWT_010604 [Skeletonema menzelii]